MGQPRADCAAGVLGRFETSTDTSLSVLALSLQSLVADRGFSVGRQYSKVSGECQTSPWTKPTCVLGHAMVRLFRVCPELSVETHGYSLYQSCSGLPLTEVRHSCHLQSNYPSFVLPFHDLGLRLADKRSLPCPRRNEWITARDELYEQIMHKAWNKDLQIFGQSYEETDVLDSSVMIMPLVFFINPSDPRFLTTLKAVLRSPERGGLTSNASRFHPLVHLQWLTILPLQNLVYRYDVNKADDGVGGEEGTFCLCTLWCVVHLLFTHLVIHAHRPTLD